MDSPERPLRILAIVNLDWDARYGASRVWMELAEQWRAAGHTVEKFCLSDAFPQPAQSRPLFALRQAFFPWRAAAFVRRRGHEFDVIDALVGTLPQSKRRLGFRGLLVARSVGLFLLYERFERMMARKHPPAAKGKLAGRVLYGFTRRRMRRDSLRAVRRADLVNVPNEEEAECLRAEFGSGREVMVQPYGLAETLSRGLREAAAPPGERLAACRVCFLGMWAPRKGAHDWAEIIRRVQAEIPGARFRFLGTMADPEVVQRDLGPEAFSQVELVATFQPDELPRLLADCTVAAFPSYVEGFGLAVIEQMAAGLPVIAYATAGPRDILRSFPEALVPGGAVVAFAAGLCRVLRLEEEAYAKLSHQSVEAAAGYRWAQIARDTIREYRKALDRLAGIRK